MPFWQLFGSASILLATKSGLRVGYNKSGLRVGYNKSGQDARTTIV
jgi:hypothetical protein